MTTVGSTTSGASATGTPGTAAQLSQNYNTFLKLLTTQMKNQDPTAPMDASQFTQQLVMYSQVEQQIDTNSKLDKLVSATNVNQATAALGYIGMQIDAPGNKFAFSGQPVDLSYGLPTAATSATISIADQSGNVVWQGKANTAAGSYNFTWDGTDGHGNTAPNGNYTISLSAVDSKNAAINGTTGVPGVVDGVETDSGTVYLTVNGTKVAASNVTTATKPTTAN